MADDDSSDDEVLDFFPGLQVQIVGLLSRPELNGTHGTLKLFDKEKGRWKVEMSDASGFKLFKEANLEACHAEPPPLVSHEAKEEVPAAEAEAVVVEVPEEPRAAPKLRPGTQVIIRGLTDVEARLNGKDGICESFLFNTGRWNVRFEDGVMRPMKKEHLVPQAARLRPGAYVRVQDLAGAPHLNGKVGICERLDPGTLRWKVRLEDSQARSLKAENLLVLDGHIPAHSADSFRMPDEERPRAKANESASFASQLEEALANGDILWEDY